MHGARRWGVLLCASWLAAPAAGAPSRSLTAARVLASTDFAVPAGLPAPPWSATSGTSAAYLRRSLVRAGSAQNAAPLAARLLAGEPVTVTALGSSVTGTFAGCTDGISPLCLGQCGGDCGAPPGYRS